MKKKITEVSVFFLLFCLFLKNSVFITQQVDTLLSCCIYIILIISIITYFLLLLKEKRINCTVSNIWLSLFILMYCLSALLSKNVNHSIWIFFSQFFVMIGVYVSLCKVYFINWNRIYKFLLFLLFLITITSITGHVFTYTSFAIAYQDINISATTQITNHYFSKGIYFNSNTFGMTLMSGVGIALLLYLINKNIKNKRFLIILFYISLAILTSYSRSALVMVIVTLLAFWLLSRKKNLRVIIKNVTKLLLCLIGTILIFRKIFNNILEMYIGKLQNTGLSHRDYLWKQAIELAHQYPLSGYGPGETQFININGGSLSAHNAYLQLLASTGYITTTLFLLFLLTLIIETIVKLRKRRFLIRDELYYTGIMCVAMSIGILVQQFFEASIGSGVTLISVLLMIFLGISNIIGNKYSKL